jgi:hypothetical protein
LKYASANPTAKRGRFHTFIIFETAIASESSTRFMQKSAGQIPKTPVADLTSPARKAHLLSWLETPSNIKSLAPLPERRALSENVVRHSRIACVAPAAGILA